MLTTTIDPDPPACPACRSEGIVFSYQVPVYVLVKAGHVTRVVVADEEIEFRSRAWCRRCGQTWTPEEEPDLGTWPAWEVGW